MIALEAKLAEIQRREFSVEESEKNLAKSKQEFELSVKTMEPQMKALRYEAEQVAQSKQHAEAYWAKVRNQADSVLVAENEILSKEREMYAMVDQISRKREDLFSLKAELQTKFAQQQSKSKIINANKFTVYECAMTLSSEIQNAQKHLISNEKRILATSQGSSAEGFMIQDSLRIMNRCQDKIDSAIKALAEKVSSSIDETIPQGDDFRSYSSRLDLEEIPRIEIEHTAEMRRDILGESSSQFLVIDKALRSKPLLGLDFKGAQGITMIEEDTVRPNTTDIKLTLDAASQSFINLKEFGKKYRVMV